MQCAEVLGRAHLLALLTPPASVGFQYFEIAS